MDFIASCIFFLLNLPILQFLGLRAIFALVEFQLFAWTVDFFHHPWLNRYVFYFSYDIIILNIENIEFTTKIDYLFFLQMFPNTWSFQFPK